MNGLIEVLHRISLTPQMIAGGLALLVIGLMALLLVRWALGGGR